MTFVKSSLNRGLERIQPVIITDAIRGLETELKFLFNGLPRVQKPTVITCFDTSGSGKTATVEEAARRLGACIIVISPVLSPALSEVLASCRKHNFIVSDKGLIDRAAIDVAFRDKFESALGTMFETMLQLLADNPNKRVAALVDDGKYQSPTSGSFERETNFKIFHRVLDALGDRQLVIHIDDCQRFFLDIVPTPDDYGTNIKQSKVMALALRSFSKCIHDFAKRSNIAWVFSGTRPNMVTEITLTSGLNTIDITDMMTDFGQQDVYTILGSYFNLESATVLQADNLNACCERLQGPPKNVLFFLSAASHHKLASIQNLLDKWDRIEADAVMAFRNRIGSSLVGNLDIIGRNLALLHANALLCTGSEFIEVPVVSRHFIHLVEAGLIRTRSAGDHWIISAPNRLLVRVFQKYVRCYKWENISMLRSCIQASSAVQTLKAKTFEYRFALELCDWAGGKLWNFLSKHTGLLPLGSSNPSIKNTTDVKSATDTKAIYVMQGPDRSESKTDVIFFATDTASGKDVRVLVQLTLENCAYRKVEDSFQGMMNLAPFTLGGLQMSDFRLFLGPNCTKDAPEHYIGENYADNSCYSFTASSGVIDAFDLDVKKICNTSATDLAIELLVTKAEAISEPELATQIANDFGRKSVSSKRVRSLSTDRAVPFAFTDMNGFYAALQNTELDETKINQIKRIFENQEIMLSTLGCITHEILKECGISQFGLRNAIMSVLGKE